MSKQFEQLPHTADIMIRVFGDTMAELFCNALIGMFQAVRPIAQGCRVEGELVVCDRLPETHMVQVTAIDYEALLVDFLSEALYLSDVHNEAYLDAAVQKIGPTHITAEVKGVKVTGFEVVELKAVTYHGLEIKQINGRWQADIVFDI